MYGVLLRAGPQALFISLMAALFARVLNPLVDVMLVDGPAQQDDMLINALTAASDNFVLIGIIALVITILGTAVIEADQGGV